MTQKQLDLTSFRNALDRLAEALEFCESPQAKKQRHLRQFFQGGAIQAFEYSYELSFKMLKRYLQMFEPNAEGIDALSFSNLVRRGYETGLLQSELEAWQKFRSSRNLSVHTYDADKAEAVYAAISAFQAEAEFLYQQLAKRGKER